MALQNSSVLCGLNNSSLLIGPSSIHLDSASGTWFWSPGLYYNVKSNEARVSLHLVSNPCGSVIFSIHLSEFWSERTTNVVTSTYGRSVIRLHPTDRNSRSVELYFISVSENAML